ncbi:MAG: hypothetical protein IVW57_01795 [Ktedonobacterales bacterium]|nr:hypothetical protein [Ktedonobacterales bacterium]
MIYQVMIRRQVGMAWVAYAAPTDDPSDVVRLIQAANQQYAEVTVLQAESKQALAVVLARLRNGELPTHTISPLPGLTATPRVTVQDMPMERRRWEIEQGPGGDHDEPYEFRLPGNMEVAAAWLRLLARRWRERPGGGAAA